MNHMLRTQHMPIDDVLTDFFRSETPKTWPDCPKVEAKPQTPPARPASAFAKWWRRSARHFTVAAAIALVLGGYWLIANQFPKNAPQGDLPGPTISIELETDNGNRILIQQKKLPNGVLEFDVHPLQNSPIPGNLPGQP